MKRLIASLSKYLGIGKPSDGLESPVREAAATEQQPDIGLGQLAFAAKTKNDTIVVFMGSIPLQYTLGMIISHTTSICPIVRNIANLLVPTSIDNQQILRELATHGKIDPTDQPFYLVTEGQIDERSAFAAELSFFDAAQICMCVADTKESFEERGVMDSKSIAISEFWNNVWTSLPDTVKMSVMQEESKVAN